MSPVTTIYTDRYPWRGPHTKRSNRPYTWMRVHGPRGIHDLWALVDSGADYLMLQTAVACRVGIDLCGIPTTYANTAGGGSIPIQHVHNVQITVEGHSATVEVYFGGHGTPLLGRTAFLAAIDFGM